MEHPRVLTYLERANQLNITPNFWLSREYLLTQEDIEFKSNRKAMWLQEDEVMVFPPLPIDSHYLHERDCPPLLIWSDFENYSKGEPVEFLDWEYVYDPNNFLDLSGGKWKIFRKNSRKWDRVNKNWYYSSTPPHNTGDIKKLLIKWLECRKEQEIEDSESLLWFIFNGSKRDFLYRGDELVGMNIWDSNGAAIMYRYCIIDPKEPFLDEFTRLLFYKSIPNRLVLDGGCLGNPGLEKFKDRLNPIKKRAIYSRSVEEK
jgi:hypothetical protein